MASKIELQRFEPWNDAWRLLLDGRNKGVFPLKTALRLAQEAAA